ncbi:MAG: hypothetical protein JSS02_23550 [Planctomycetes bacterium]|nr:hypothetical protein [Planctomycetota bacterium]
MISIRRVSAIAFASALCGLATAHATEEIEIESPAPDAVYLSTSDIVLVGHCQSFGSQGTAKILLAKNNAQYAKESFKTGTREENGRWACWIVSPERRGWIPNARLAEITIAGRTVDIPIKIVPDLLGDGTPLQAPATAVDSDEYSKLPAVKFETVSFRDSEDSPSKLVSEVKVTDSAILVDGMDEFAVEGTLRSPKSDAQPSREIILRLTESPAGAGDGKKAKVIVAESLALFEPNDDRTLFRYRTVLRAPNRPGKLTLEATYRRQRIATAVIEVRPTAAEESPKGWVVEYPPPNAVYSTISDIVVAGRGGPAPMSFAVYMLDADNVVRQSAGATTGGRLEDGAWSTRLRLPGGTVWRVDKYEMEFLPVYGRQIVFPVQVVAGPKKPDPSLEKPTNIGGEDYDALPCLKLADVILSTPDNATPNVTARKEARDVTFKIRAGAEFACEGDLTFQEDGAFYPSNVILRLTESTAREGRNPADPKVTVGETISKYNVIEQAGRRYPFRSVLQAPNAPGKLTLDAFYRKTVIATATIEIVPPTEK